MAASRRLLRLATLLAALAATQAVAHDYRLGALEIVRPWSRATPKGAPVAGGYLKIVNTGTTADRLVGGSIEVAKRFEIHEMRMDGATMRMRELVGGLALPPGATVALEPGGMHLMFMELARPLTKGERIKGTLMFEKAGKVDVEFLVEAIGATPGAHQH